jgi:hypothetical protein
MTQKEICLNCNTPLHGKYCHACGQKRIEDRERTFRYFCYQFFGATFFLENNLIKNLWHLLTRPGFLAVEYLDGKRKRHMTPISLFLLINFIYFFAVFLSDLNLTLTEQVNQPGHGSLAKAMVQRRIASREITFDDYAESFNERSTSLSKTLIILHAPILALMIMLLYLKKNYYYTDHIIFSLYLMAFVLLFSIISINLLLFLAKHSIITPRMIFQISGHAQLVVYPVYFTIAVKKFYRQSLGITLVKSLLVMAFFMVAHFVYRTLLFFAVFWTT